MRSPCPPTDLPGLWEEAYASPQTPPTSLSSGSSLGRRSRRAKGSSEDSSEDIPLRVQSFRVGGPILATPGAEIQGILQRGHIASTFFHLVFYPTENHPAPYPCPTILVIVSSGESEAEWIPVAGQIRRCCINIGEPELNVELRDKRAFQKTLSYPIASTDPVVPRWESVKEEIIACLRGTSWLSLSLLRRGKPSGPKPEIAVLTITKTSIDDWVLVREDMIQVLDARGLKHVGVEIIRGEILQNQEDRMILDESSFNVKMAMGLSVGPRHSLKNPSTFGGYVKIKNKIGTWYQLGLTCFRSVAPGNSNHRALRRWRPRGITPNDKENDLGLDSPSLGDVEETRRAWRARVEGQKDDRFRDVERRQADPLGFVTPREEAIHAETKKLIKFYEEKLQISEDFLQTGNEYVGEVFAASGLRLGGVSDPPKAVDWALIKVDKARFLGNMLPKLSDLPPKLSSSIDYSDAAGTMLGVAPISPDMDLYKIGRSTGFTAGRLNGVGMTELHSWQQNDDGSWKEVRSTAYCVVPTADTNQAFGEGGDSGAFVINNKGRFVGLYFGASTDNTGYFTSAEDLIEDIKRVTGAVDVSFEV